MRAIVVRAPGGSDQLDLARVPAPELVSGTVEIEIKACALNRADLLQRLGRATEAAGAYDAAIACTENAAERAFLQRRKAASS